MVTNKWDKLAELADLTFEAQSQKMSKLQAQQAELERQRKHLRDKNCAALRVFVGVHPAHWQSGDFHWQAWVSENMQRLGIEQAQVRAKVEIQKPELRRAFGKKSVLEELVRNKTH